jgi:hypothetical protein
MEGAMALVDRGSNSQAVAPRTARRMVLLGGKLVYGPNLLTQDCSIRDRSEGGVRVRLFAAEPLPNQLWFLNIRERTAHLAEVVWRRYPDIGLSLLAPVDLESEDTVEQRTLRRLLVEALPRKSGPLKLSS